MSFTVKTRYKVLKNLKKFPRRIRKNIEELIFILKENPLPYLRFDVVKMKGYEHTYRIRIGKIRVIYRINFKNKTIQILDANYRGKIYK